VQVVVVVPPKKICEAQLQAALVQVSFSQLCSAFSRASVTLAPLPFPVTPIALPRAPWHEHRRLRET
jgi:hypothetical protein